MRKLTLAGRTLLCLLLVAGVAGAAFSRSTVTGSYRLFLTDDSGWHNNEISITSSTGDLVEGIVTIDWGIGPQARAPNPDERTWKVPFKGKWRKDGGLEFQVTVGKLMPARYSFELYPTSGDRVAFVGIVAVDRGKAYGSGPSRHGVWAAR